MNKLADIKSIKKNIQKDNVPKEKCETSTIERYTEQIFFYVFTQNSSTFLPSDERNVK